MARRIRESDDLWTLHHHSHTTPYSSLADDVIPQPMGLLVVVECVVRHAQYLIDMAHPVVATEIMLVHIWKQYGEVESLNRETDTGKEMDGLMDREMDDKDRGQTQASAVGLQGHIAVLLLQIFVAQQDPCGVVSLVESDGPPEVGNGLVMVTTETVKVSYEVKKEERKG